MVALPLAYAIAASIVIGMVILAVLSYYIAITHDLKPGRSVVEHLVVAMLVLVASQLIGSTIRALFAA